MRDDTRKKFERALMLRRLKMAGIGVAVAAVIGAGFWFMGLEATVETRQVPGVVTAVGPFVGTNSVSIEQGLSVDVKLESGRTVQVVALRAANPKAGDKVEIAEHHHGTGRVTYSWK